MVEQASPKVKSRKFALELYDTWVRERQERPNKLQCAKNERELEQMRLVNFTAQLAGPRQKHLEKLKEAASEMTTADKVALLVMLELPALEISSLLHRLSIQLAARPDATYFNEVNQADNCGSGCGWGCAAMASLPYAERINAHMDTKPFSIDPFNEVGIPEKERDALLARDFLESHEALAAAVSERVNSRYYRMGQDFGNING